MIYSARVIPGRGEGRKLGFPTLNLDIPSGFEAEQGIYAGWAWLGDENSERLPAAIHYGPAPAFGIQKASLEVHIIGQDLASTPAGLSLQLVKYLRPVAHFEALEGLQGQIREDIRQALEALERV